MRVINTVFAAFLAVLTGAIAMAWSGAWSGDAAASLSAEDGPLEMLHVVMLALAACFYIYGYHTSTGHWKTAAAMLACVVAAACLREFEFDTYKDVAWLQSARSYRLHWLLLAAFMSPLIVHIIRTYQHIPAAMLLAFKPYSWPLLTAGALIAAGMLIDRGSGPVDGGHFAEEVFETYGYAFLLFDAVRHNAIAARNGANSG